MAAQTAGIPARVPLVGSRLPWKTPFGLKTVEPGEKATSLMVYWVAGTMSPPLGSQSPDSTSTWEKRCDVSDADTGFCNDPHEFPRRTPEAQEHRNGFFATGTIRDVCGSGPCRTRPRS